MKHLLDRVRSSCYRGSCTTRLWIIWKWFSKKHLKMRKKRGHIRGPGSRCWDQIYNCCWARWRCSSCQNRIFQDSYILFMIIWYARQTSSQRCSRSSVTKFLSTSAKCFCTKKCQNIGSIPTTKKNFLRLALKLSQMAPNSSARCDAISKKVNLSCIHFKYGFYSARSFFKKYNKIYNFLQFLGATSR